MLAGGVLGAAANFGATFGIQCSPSWKSARSPPAYSKTVIASSVIRLTDDTDVPTLSSTYTPWIELRFTSPKLFGESCVVCRLFEDLESRSSGFQSLPQDLQWDSVAQLVLSIAKKSLRNSRTHSWPSDVLDSSDSRFVNSPITKPRIMLCHCCRVVLLITILLLFVAVDQFLVQRLIERLEILQTSLDIAVFPEPILPGADVVQQNVAWRLPSVVLDDFSSVRESYTCSSSPPYFWCHFRYQFSRWFSRAWYASWEDRDNSSLCLSENRTSASCSSCRTCIRTL